MTPQEQLMVEAARRGLLNAPAPSAREQVMATIPKATSGGMARNADDLVRSIASGATFGLADEMAAGASTLTGIGERGAPTMTDLVREKAGGSRYERNLAAERARDAAIPSGTKLVGELAGGMMTGTGLARQGVTLLNAARPTVGSMAARGAGEGAAYGTAHGFGRGEGVQDRLEQAAYGGTVGAVTGGGTGAVAGKMAQSGARKTIPSTDALKAQSNAAYKAADDAGVVVHRGRFGDAIDDIVNLAKTEGLDPDIHKGATAAVNRLLKERGHDISLEKLDQLRQIIRESATTAGDGRITSLMIGRLDDFIDRLSVKDIVSGDALKGTSALNQARDLWSRMRKSEVIDTLVDNARTSAQQFSGSGYENALRTQFRALAKNQNAMRKFSEEERDAIKLVARGGPVDNALRYLGKLAPRGVVSGGFSLGVGSAVDPTLGFATMALGEMGRRGATAMTKGNVNALSDIVRSGGSLPQPGPLTPAQLSMLQAALIGQAQQEPQAIDTLLRLNTARR